MRGISAILFAIMLAACEPQPVATVEAVQQRYETGTQRYEADWATFERTAQRGQSFGGNLEPLADYLRATMRQRRNGEARERAAVYLTTMPFYQTGFTSEDAGEVVAAAPAESLHWAAAPLGIDQAANVLPEAEARVFLNDLIARNSERLVQGRALYALTLLERQRGNLDAYRASYARLEPYADVQDLRFFIRTINPANKVAIGGEAPAFALRELGGDAIVSSESLRGRYYLIEFWATWCGPCLTERAALTRAQERFGGDRFTIVSVSMDQREETAITYRQNRWPMDWVNLYAPGSRHSEEDFSFGGDVAEAYEITWIGLPQLALVSPEGRVLALRDQLERAQLERTLETYLGEGG